MNKARSQQGFTLIELLLAMAFISVLLLFSVSAIMHITRLYVKGSAIRQINQTGRQTVDTFARSMRYSDPYYAADKQRICSAGVTYAWNTLSSEKNYFAGSNPRAAVRFVAVQDATGEFCDGGDIPRDRARDIVGPDIAVVRFAVAERGGMWDISLMLSTSGESKVEMISPDTYRCAPDNPYCAFGEFETSVYKRRFQK